MMLKALLFMVFFLSLPVLAQDERYFRQILKGEVSDPTKYEVLKPIQDFVLRGKSYRIDLNSDGMEETIQPLKKDGVDWLEIRNSSENILFSGKLFAMGSNSTLYKIKLVHLSPKVKTLILFLDEGGVSGKKFEATAKIFIISYENNDLSQMKLSAGPHFFHEKESVREQYWRRNYQVNVYDTDHDGVRDIAIQFNHIQRIMFYKGRGEWEQF
jgi:hypothetical protein